MRLKIYDLLASRDDYCSILLLESHGSFVLLHFLKRRIILTYKSYNLHVWKYFQRCQHLGQSLNGVQDPIPAVQNHSNRNSLLPNWNCLYFYTKIWMVSLIFSIELWKDYKPETERATKESAWSQTFVLTLVLSADIDGLPHDPRIKSVTRFQTSITIWIKTSKFIFWIIIYILNIERYYRWWKWSHWWVE